MSRLTYLKLVFPIILSAFMSLNALADEGPLQANETEVAAVQAINAPYYDAFKGPTEENWVYQLANNNELKAHCYLSKTESIPVGETVNYQEIEMTCIQVGKSTRVFWPARWADHCQSIDKPYNVCMMSEITIK